MKNLVAVFDTHDDAVSAIDNLQKQGFAEKNLSLVAKAEAEEEDTKIKTSKVELGEIGLGVGAGAALGLLTGVGMFAIPGFGMLYGAGAVVGLLAGVDLGIMGGGALAVLTSLGFAESSAKKHAQHLHDNKCLVIVHGTPDEIHKAEDVITAQGLHWEVAKH